MRRLRIRLFGQFVHVSIVALAVLEAAICFAAPFVAVYIRFAGEVTPKTYATFTPGAIAYAVAMVPSMIAMGLYAFQQRAQSAGIALRLIAAALVATLVLAVVVFFFPSVDFGRGVLAWTIVVSTLACFTVRMLFMFAVSEEALKRRVLVFGAGQRAQAITQLRRRTDRRGFNVLGFIRPADSELLIDADRLIESDKSLYDLVCERDVSEVVVALDDRRGNFPVEELLNCRLRGIDVIDIVSFLERETGKVRVDMLSPSWIIFSAGFRRDPFRQGLERGFDILVSMLLLAATWPLMVLAWLAIKLEDGWSAPVLYRQIRVGLEGKLFTLRKFRSMRLDAEADGKAQWATKNDSRVTMVGSVIRKTRIDELPQLINVLVGDMCFVGPRPERPQFVDEFSERIPYYRERHWVKPGITGWAQLCYPYGASERDAKEKLQYDLYYVKHRNLMFDLFILLQTAEVILWGRGAR